MTQLPGPVKETGPWPRNGFAMGGLRKATKKKVPFAKSLLGWRYSPREISAALARRAPHS